MGNTFFCDRCDIDKYKLSRECADQFLTGEADKVNSEERWLQKLRCLDDAHSKLHDLTPEGFDTFLGKLENNLSQQKQEIYSKNKNILIECLKKNENCILNCQSEMNEFIDCIDTLRIRQIKRSIHESAPKKRNTAELANLLNAFPKS